jgi:uncharacterized protein YbjT (DUF2867 family)
LARCLLIGCGCRGLGLAGLLRADGHALRGTTRRVGRVAELEAAGVEAHVGDPDRVATLAPALDHVVVACVLLGSAEGSADQLAALHGPRLEMLLTRMVDSTVRGVVYESRGTVDREVLQGGAARVRAACQDSLIPYALLDADPLDHDGWAAEAHAVVTGLLR